MKSANSRNRVQWEQTIKYEIISLLFNKSWALVSKPQLEFLIIFGSTALIHNETRKRKFEEKNSGKEY